MKNYKLSKWEWVWIIAAVAILVGLFISSSMTYHEQKLHPGFINQHLGFLEHYLSGVEIHYGGKIHSAAVNGMPAFTEFVVRKFAHFATYFLLGMTLYLASKPVFRIRFFAPINIWLMVVGLAALDEYHQYLTGDRTPSVHDVMLDGLGAFFGILLVVIIQLIIYAFKNQKQN
ncbi:VanZ family protein [uncultured Lactobacillus sp.]|uniref:VanZ family protein n=1 Tax=uncultured Lactobacillus sp. TaxID=153152 RepID=UPI0026397D97|nr:VanZ family protein [uncultured Lactobacillus sp.]